MEELTIVLMDDWECMDGIDAEDEGWMNGQKEETDGWMDEKSGCIYQRTDKWIAELHG